MEEDDFCEICLENYNVTDKVPKTLECCNKVFCLKCLHDIYKKNANKILCPICRKIITNKTPNDLISEKSRLELKTICPNCRTASNSQNLKFKFAGKGTTQILCNNCCPSDDSILLKDYLLNLSEEMNYFMCSFGILKNAKYFDETLDDQIEKYLDDFFRQIKKGLKNKLKNSIFLNLESHHNSHQFSSANFFNDFNKFEEFYNILENFKNKEIKTNDLINIKLAVEFYINKSDNLRKNGFILKKTIEEISKNNLLILDQNLVKFSELENFMNNILTIKIETKKYNNFNYIDEFEFNSGIEFIDKKLIYLKQENENLNLSIKKERDIISKSFENEMKVLMNKASVNKTNKIINFNHNILSIQNFNFVIPNNINNYLQRNLNNNYVEMNPFIEQGSQFLYLNSGNNNYLKNNGNSNYYNIYDTNNINNNGNLISMNNYNNNNNINSVYNNNLCPNTNYINIDIINNLQNRIQINENQNSNNFKSDNVNASIMQNMNNLSINHNSNLPNRNYLRSNNNININLTNEIQNINSIDDILNNQPNIESSTNKFNYPSF